jgi:hypothetical protein
LKTLEKLVQILGDGFINAKHAPELEKELNLDMGHTQEPTRDLIRRAIVNHNYPIGSTREGFFLIDSEKELNNVIKGLQRRIDGLQNRINGIRTGWNIRQESREKGENWPKS